MSLLDDLHKGPLRPAGGLEELAAMHYPLDHILGAERYEAAIVEEVSTNTSCTAILGNPGVGKSSLIGYVMRQASEDRVVVPVIIRGRALDEPGNFDHFLAALLAGSITAAQDAEVATDASLGADTVQVSEPSGKVGAELGGGPVPGKLIGELESQKHTFEAQTKDFDRLEAAQRLITSFKEHGYTPLFILHDVEAHLGRDADQAQIEAFFRVIVGALVDDLDAPSLLAVQTRFRSEPAYGLLQEKLHEVDIPRLPEEGRWLDALFTHRMQESGLQAQAGDAFTDDALIALAASYHRKADLRETLAVAEAAVVHALDDAPGDVENLKVEAADVNAALGGFSN